MWWEMNGTHLQRVPPLYLTRHTKPSIYTIALITSHLWSNSSPLPGSYTSGLHVVSMSHMYLSCVNIIMWSYYILTVLPFKVHTNDLNAYLHCKVFSQTVPSFHTSMIALTVFIFSLMTINHTLTMTSNSMWQELRLCFLKTITYPYLLF